jgi:hypothetical protein
MEMWHGWEMASDNNSKDLDFGDPAVYRVVVQGSLTQAWVDRMADMKITAVSQGSSAPHTELRGLVRDQAELSGVLETLHSLHLPIVKLERVDEKG